MDWDRGVQLTVALTAGVGCGIVIGVLLASRRRLSLPSSGIEAVRHHTTCSSLHYNSCFIVFQRERILSFDHVSDEYKMVFVVRNDLKMGKGKVAAQVSIVVK